MTDLSSDNIALNLSRPLQCIYTPCGQEIAYKSLLSHLIMTHQIEGTDNLPANITYDVTGPLMDC